VKQKPTINEVLSKLSHEEQTVFSIGMHYGWLSEAHIIRKHSFLLQEGMWDTISNTIFNKTAAKIGHGILDVIGLIPVIGAWADVSNAAWYYFDTSLEENERYLLCGLSALSAVPLFGIFSTMLKGTASVSTKAVVYMDGIDWERPKWGKNAQRMLKLAASAAFRWGDAVYVDNDEAIEWLEDADGRRFAGTLCAARGRRARRKGWQADRRRGKIP